MVQDGCHGPPRGPERAIRRGERVHFDTPVSRLSFRARLFLALFVVSALPAALVSVAGIFYVRTVQFMQGTGNLDDLQRTGRTMMAELAREDLSPGARLAVARYDTTLVYVIGSSRKAVGLASGLKQRFPYIATISALALIFVVGVIGSILSRQFSKPLDEVVDWTDRIQRHDPLPERANQRGIPEFATLQGALRELQRGLEQARASELEAERLRAFGEVARRVAHEMKNPLTPIRLAVAQLSRTAPVDMRETLEIIAAESSRLEAMAREFAALGRLPEGVAAPVELGELLEELLRATMPEGYEARFTRDDDIPPIDGYYDPLRRAFSNVLRNAVEACGVHGSIAVALRRVGRTVEVAISDNGPGIPTEKRELIFEPYYTEKGDGTGLGLAIVRQTIEQHHGTITVAETPGGGATFLVRFPA